MNRCLRHAIYLLLISLGIALFGQAAWAKTPAEHKANGPQHNVEHASDVIGVESAWIRPTAPGQSVTGAFLTLINRSSRDYSLTGAEFDGANVVEIHETSMSDGRMRMRMVDQVDIPANGKAELKPGSYHIMLIGLEKSLEQGSEQELVLFFSDGSKKTITARVKPMNESNK